MASLYQKDSNILWTDFGLYESEGAVKAFLALPVVQAIFENPEDTDLTAAMIAIDQMLRSKYTLLVQSTAKQENVPDHNKLFRPLLSKCMADPKSLNGLPYVNVLNWTGDMHMHARRTKEVIEDVFLKRAITIGDDTIKVTSIDSLYGEYPYETPVIVSVLTEWHGFKATDKLKTVQEILRSKTYGKLYYSHGANSPHLSTYYMVGGTGELNGKTVTFVTETSTCLDPYKGPLSVIVEGKFGPADIAKAKLGFTCGTEPIKVEHVDGIRSSPGILVKAMQILTKMTEASNVYACDVCRKPTTLHCPCFGAYYCGKECQRHHWKTHKKKCPKINPSTPAEDTAASPL